MPSMILSILYHVLSNLILTTILWGQFCTKEETEASKDYVTFQKLRSVQMED